MYDEMRQISASSKLVQENVSDIVLLPHSALESQSHASRPISAWEVQPDKLIDVGSDDFLQVLAFPYSADPRAENVGTLSHNMFTASKKFESPYVVRDDGTAHPYR